MAWNVLLAAREPEPRCRYVRDRWNHAGMIKIEKTFVQFLAVRRGIEEMAWNVLLAAREPEPRCRYVRDRWNHAGMIKIEKTFVQ